MKIDGKIKNTIIEYKDYLLISLFLCLASKILLRIDVYFEFTKPCGETTSCGAMVRLANQY